MPYQHQGAAKQAGGAAECQAEQGRLHNSRYHDSSVKVPSGSAEAYRNSGLSAPRKRGTRTDGADFMDLSVVIPVKNEAENIAPLVGEIRAALDGFIAYEILFIDEAIICGSTRPVNLAVVTGTGLLTFDPKVSQ